MRFDGCPGEEVIISWKGQLTWSPINWRGERKGSKSKDSGSISMGDCLRPLLHKLHLGLSRPQKLGPKKEEENKSWAYLFIIFFLEDQSFVIDSFWWTITDPIIFNQFG